MYFLCHNELSCPSPTRTYTPPHRDLVPMTWYDTVVVTAFVFVPVIVAIAVSVVVAIVIAVAVAFS